MDRNSILTSIESIRAIEFKSIGMTDPQGPADCVVIRYEAGDIALTLTFAVVSELSLGGNPVLMQGGEPVDVAWAGDDLAGISAHFCTQELYVLIKRYQFLVNSCKWDDSLRPQFRADARGEHTQIDYYPLMNLLTAYYESH